MQILRKWLVAGFGAALMTGLLSGCPQTPPDQAAKEAATKVWTDSYNYEGNFGIEIKADPTAILGTKGGLTAEQAETEKQAAEAFKAPQGQQGLAMLQSMKYAFHGAVDSKNLKSDVVLDISYAQGGEKTAFQVPLLVDLKGGPALYVDPQKAAQTLHFPLPELNGKLIKLTLSDIPNLTAEQRKKLQPDGEFLKKLKQIVTESLNGIDPKLFKDVEVSEAAKKAGAVRTIQLTQTAQQSDKFSKDMFTKLLDAFSADLKLTPEEVAMVKQKITETNKELLPFMGNVIQEYSLDSSGRIVSLTNTQSYRGAGQTAKATVTIVLKDYDKPTFTVDPAKQGSVSLSELKAKMDKGMPGQDASAPATK